MDNINNLDDSLKFIHELANSPDCSTEQLVALIKENPYEEAAWLAVMYFLKREDFIDFLEEISKKGIHAQIKKNASWALEIKNRI